MLTLKKVNKTLADMGLKMELVKGKDYFYFSGDDVDLCNTEGVCVSFLNDLPLDAWVHEAEKVKCETPSPNDNRDKTVLKLGFKVC